MPPWQRSDLYWRCGPIDARLCGTIVSLDGVYDQDGVYGEIAERHPDAAVIVPLRSSAVPSKMAEIAPTQRDRHLQLIAECGRMGRQKASGYNLRALVEAEIGRWKRVIGEALHSQTDGRQATDMAITVNVLNRMLELGRPNYVASYEIRKTGCYYVRRVDPCNKVPNRTRTNGAEIGTVAADP
jgi:hypothetical protein